MNRILRFVLFFAIAGVILFQLGWVTKTFENYTTRKVLPDRPLDAIDRSADVAYGSDFLVYIDFLQAHIPQQATVVDTKTFGLPQYDINTFLQYFLFPRNVILLTDTTCQHEPDLNQCIINLSGLQTYFIYGENFAITPRISGMFQVLPFNPHLGLLAPHSRQGQP
jgi:hypothetical protein